MQRSVRVAAVLGSVWWMGGCSIDGTWKTVKTDPADMMDHAPFKMVTFSEADGTFSSTAERGGEVRTITGSYTWDGMKLVVKPTASDERTYAGCLNLIPKQLILNHEKDGEKSTAWLEPVSESSE